MINDFKNQLITGILTSPILYIPHYHFAFIDEILSEILLSGKIPELSKNCIVEYDLTRFIVDFDTKESNGVNVGLIGLLKEIVQRVLPPNEGEKDRRIVKEYHRIFLFKNIHRELEDKSIQCLLQTFVEKYERNDYASTTSIIMVSSLPSSLLPREISKLFAIIQLPLPDHSDIEHELGLADEQIDSLCWTRRNPYETHGYRYGISFMHKETNFKNNRRELVGALMGMQVFDIRRVLKTIQHLEGDISPRYTESKCKLSDRILMEKRQIINNSSLLDIIHLDSDQQNRVGNIEALSGFVEKQKRIIDNIVKYPSTLPKPKGILLIGPPGCGKSETVKTIAAKFDKPLVRLDIGRLMGQYVGQSEHNLIDAIRVAEAAQPCVLWIDEIEKAFAGFGNDNHNNDITVTRMVGYFLTWMQERKSLVYLVATANDLSNLRPEFLRKGRWDEIFYLSYPDANGAEDIFCKCLQKYNLCLTDGKDCVVDQGGNRIEENKLSALSREIANSYFSGAEIDSLIVQSFNDDWDGTVSNSIEYKTVLKILKKITKNKTFAKEKKLQETIENVLFELKLRAGQTVLTNEEGIKALLRDKYKSKTPLELNAEFESKGYVSAS